MATRNAQNFNVWEILGFWGSENYLLLNNRTRLHLVHISSFLARNWHLGIQRELVLWIFDILSFSAIFRIIISQKQHIFRFQAKFGLKSRNIKNPKNKFSLYSKMPVFCKKRRNMDKMEMTSIVQKQIFRPPKSQD